MPRRRACLIHCLSLLGGELLEGGESASASCLFFGLFISSCWWNQFVSGINFISWRTACLEGLLERLLVNFFCEGLEPDTRKRLRVCLFLGLSCNPLSGEYRWHYSIIPLRWPRDQGVRGLSPPLPSTACLWGYLWSSCLVQGVW